MSAAMPSELERKLARLEESWPERASIPVLISVQLLRSLAQDFPPELDGGPPRRIRLVALHGPDERGFYEPVLRLESDQ